MTTAMKHFIETLKKVEPTIVDTIQYIEWLALMASPLENRETILDLLQQMCYLCGVNYSDLLLESAKVACSECQ